MGLAAGCNHIALVTSDLDAFIDFYQRVFDAEVIGELREGGLRHALVDVGGGFALHPFEFVDGSEYAAGQPTIFRRGHLDHLAIDVADEESFELLRGRLVEAGATDGTVTDFGLIRTVWFEDPDGMGCEIAMWAKGRMLAFKDRIVEPLVDAATAAST